MSASNNRVLMPLTFHHLMSRIAHKVFILEEEERDEFIEMMRRVAEFTGIKLVAWCIMANHFHILAYLPEAEPLDDAEVKRRYRVLKGKALEDDFPGEIERLRKQMYSIGSFMKILKQWFTTKYNQRYAHKGTLWESVYKDVVVKDIVHERAKCAAYIHLNPIRAAITPEYDGYAWSSYAALVRGDQMALDGMRMIYGAAATREEIVKTHRELMSKCLESIKKERAIEIAKMREAGLPAPADHLTTEVGILREMECRKRAIETLVAESEKRCRRGRPSGGNKVMSERIRVLREANPEISAADIAKELESPISTVYLYLRRMKGITE